MIDSTNGTISLEPEGCTLGPGMALDTVLQFALHIARVDAPDATSGGGPHYANLDLRLTLYGAPFLGSLYFKDRKLYAIFLMNPDPQFGTSWEDASQEKELARKDSHDAWLRSVLGGDPPIVYPWGSITSVFDPKELSSTIIIRYTGLPGIGDVVP